MTDSKKTSSENIYVSLCRFQASMPTVEKKRTASYKLKSGFTVTFKYADLTDIWDAIRKPLTDNGLSLIQLVQTEDGRNYIITKLFYVSGECIESKTLIEFTASKFTEVGSAISYYRRYSLSAMLGIVSDEDVDDKIEKQEEIYKKAQTPKISEHQVQMIKTLINGFDEIYQRMIKRYQSLENIDVSDFQNVMSTIKKLIADKEGR